MHQIHLVSNTILCQINLIKENFVDHYWTSIVAWSYYRWYDSWHIDRPLCHCACAINTTINTFWQLKMFLWYITPNFPLAIELILCTCCSLTFWQLHKWQSSHIKLFHSTGGGLTRMQLANVVIVFCFMSEGLLEYKCVEMYLHGS